MVCGRRWGKSWLGINLASDIALAGYPVGWLAPTYKILMDAWRQITTILAPVIKGRPNKTDKRLDLVTGGCIEFWSLDSGMGPRSRKYARVIVDEAALIKDPEIFPAAIMPTLADYQGSAWLFSTPWGRNWFWNLYGMGQDPLQPDWASWQRPTVTNPYINPAEIELQRAFLPAHLFEQEYLAQFLENGSGVFRGVDKVAVLKPLEAPLPGGIYTFGVDWGKSNDFTVISIFDARAKQQVKIDRFNEIDWEFQKERLLTLANVWRPRQILAEENSMGGPMLSALRREKQDVVTLLDPEYLGQPEDERTQVTHKRLPISGFNTTADSKGPMIESYALAIERGEIKLLDDSTPEGRVQKAELEAYELERLPSGRYRYSAPTGLHDDTVIGGGLGWQTLERRGVMSTAPNPFYKGAG